MYHPANGTRTLVVQPTACMHRVVGDVSFPYDGTLPRGSKQSEVELTAIYQIHGYDGRLWSGLLSSVTGTIIVVPSRAAECVSIISHFGHLETQPKYPLNETKPTRESAQ